MKDPKRKRSNQTKEERNEEKSTLVKQVDGNDMTVVEKKYPPKVPLNRCQINRAIKDHEDVHPLQQLSDWHHISPVFNLCCVKKPMSFKFALKDCLLKELKIPKSEEDWLEEPFLLLGFGTNTYFTILATLQNILLAITIFVIPLFYIYASGKHYGDSNPLDKLYIGNFGASTMFAKAVPLVNERMHLRCPKGTVLDTDNAHFGILSNEFKSFIHCHRSVVQEEVLEKGYKDCELAVEWRKRSIFKDVLMLLCKGKRECQIKPRVDDLFRYSLGTSLGSACDQESYIYMQIPCLFPESKMARRKLIGLFISCTAVFIFLFVQITLNYIRRVESNRFVDWDIQTVSAADYTVEFSISGKQYAYFEEHYLDTDSVISDIVQFKLYVKQEMEQRLTEFPALHLEDMDGDFAPVKIAMITFAFDNAEVIYDLKRRGTYIKQEKWAKLEIVNRQIVDKLKKTTKKGNSLLDKLQKPVSCFMTMESEEGKCRADMYNEFVERPAYRRYQKFLGGDIDVQPAAEPTDIIWENRHITVFQKFQRSIIVSIGIGLLLALSFYLILTAQINARNLKMKYPRQDCSDFQKDYSNRQLYWERDAVNEYVQNEEIENGDGFALYTGPMQCFCENEKKAGGRKDRYYTLKNQDGKTTFSGQICLDYVNDKVKSKLYGLSITLIIVVINLILKTLIVKMVKWIGVDTVSQQMGIISKAVFLAQFFNTGIIIMMVNANLVEHEPTELTQIFRGQYTDYMPDWFLDVGRKIIVTYFVQGLLPFITIAKVTIVTFLKMYWDTKFTRDPYITRKTSMRSYAETYSSGQFPIDLRFSEAMVTFFMAMTHGLGMPIMFPMAAVILANQRLCSRIFVAKFAQQPPSMDDAICKSVLQILNLAPFFSLFNWYWLMDNKLMFNNAWKYKMTVTESMMSSHLVEVTSLNQATPLLYFVFLATFVSIVRSWMHNDIATILNLDPPEQQIPVDEDLPKFFDCIKFSDANILLAENKHLQDYYYFEIIRPELVQKLKEVGYPERIMQGTPWYNVTTNPTYTEMFSYVGPQVKNREKYIKDHDNDQENNFLQSDVVNIILNLSAIPDEVAKKLDLNYFDSYFNNDFIGFMEQYIEDFSKIHNKKWQFADKININEYLMWCKQRDPVWTIRNPEYYDLLLEDKLRYWKNKTKKSEQTAFLTTLETSLKDNETYGSGIRRYIESENRNSQDQHGFK